MRFFNKLTMAVAAIFFAVSFSTPAIADLDSADSAKVYQVCKKWRVDQGGWMPTEDMQHCRNVLGAIVDAQCSDFQQGTCQEEVDAFSKNRAKYCLRGEIPSYCPDT